MVLGSAFSKPILFAWEKLSLFAECITLTPARVSNSGVGSSLLEETITISLLGPQVFKAEVTASHK